MPNAGVCVVPNAEVAGFANVLPNGVVVVVPNPTDCPNPVLVAVWPKSGLVCPKRLVVWVEAGVEKENPVDWVVPKPVVGCAGFPKSELFWKNGLYIKFIRCFLI